MEAEEVHIFKEGERVWAEVRKIGFGGELVVDLRGQEFIVANYSDRLFSEGERIPLGVASVDPLHLRLLSLKESSSDIGRRLDILS
jgi:hypothetical protein